MKLNSKAIDFCLIAYKQLKDDKSPHAVWMQFRENEPDYIDYLMERKNWYHGEWSLYVGGVFFMTVDETLLKDWYEIKFPK